MIELFLFAAIACLLGLIGAKLLDRYVDRPPRVRRRGSDTPFT
jgi:hypothetical protein